MSSSAQTKAVVSLDPVEPSNIENPFPFFARLREEAPVYWSEKYSFWMLSRYRDVKEVLLQPKKFSSVTKAPLLDRREHLPQDLHKSFDVAVRFFYGHMHASDPPVHTEQRQAVMKDFMSLVTGVIKESLERRVSELLDGMEQAGTCDFVKDFAYPLPSQIIFDLLGVPEEYHQIIRETSELIIRFPTAVYQSDSAVIVKMAEKAKDAEAAIRQLIEMRRREPKEDLISSLVRPENAIGRLPDEDIVVLCVFLLTAGHETTANLLGGSLRYLLQDRRQWEQLIATPDILPGAVEELLRFVSPVLWLARVTQEDIKMDGQVLPKGSQVMVGFGSANHDPAQFPDPETLDITRKNVYSLAFGYGIHTCIGAALARMETQVALYQLMKRFPRIQLLNDRFEYQPVYFLRALKSMPVAVNSRQ
jgi:cytochrome P450